jgi:hypothetical protein
MTRDYIDYMNSTYFAFADFVIDVKVSLENEHSVHWQQIAFDEVPLCVRDGVEEELEHIAGQV